jgi:hypothetical protein
VQRGDVEGKYFLGTGQREVEHDQKDKKKKKKKEETGEQRASIDTAGTKPREQG